MGLKNTYWNNLLKAQKRGDQEGIKLWRGKIADLRRARRRKRQRPPTGDPTGATSPLTELPEDYEFRFPNPTSQTPDAPPGWPPGDFPRDGDFPEKPRREPIPETPEPVPTPIPDGPEEPAPPKSKGRSKGGLKNKYQNELRKAQKRGDAEAIRKWQGLLDALVKQRGDAAWERAKAKREGRPYVPKTGPTSGGYQVKAGDNWFSIAGEIYGDQRLAGQLMEANKGFKMLHPGDIIKLPQFGAPASGERVEFSQSAYDTALNINEALREAEQRERGIDWDFKQQQLLSSEDEVALAAAVADAIRNAAPDFDPLNLEDRRTLAGRPEVLQPGTQPVVKPGDPFMDKFERFDFDREVEALVQAEEADFDSSNVEDRRSVAGRPEVAGPGTERVERPDDPFAEKNERFGLDDEVVTTDGQRLESPARQEGTPPPEEEDQISKNIKEREANVAALEELRKWRDEQLAGVTNQRDRQRIEKEYLDLVNQVQQGRRDEALDEIGVTGRTGERSEISQEEFNQSLLNISTSGDFELDTSVRPDAETLATNYSQIIDFAAGSELNANELAYVLATAHHESSMGGELSERWDCLDESGSVIDCADSPFDNDTDRANHYFISKYYDDVNVRRQLGNDNPSDAYVFHGRGFVQLTGRGNYQRVADHFYQNGIQFFDENGQEINLDLTGSYTGIANPRAALDPQVATYILVYGMQNGVFSTNSLEDYQRDDGTFDFVSARDIVNGNDNKYRDRIAEIAEAYAEVLNELCKSGALPEGIVCVG